MQTDFWIKNFEVRLDNWDNEGTHVKKIAGVDLQIDEDKNGTHDRALRQAIEELVENHKEELKKLYLKSFEEINRE